MEPLIINITSGCNLQLEGDKSIKIIIDGNSDKYFFEEVQMFEEQSPAKIKEVKELVEQFLRDPEAEIQVTSTDDNLTTMTIKKGSFKDHIQLIFTNKNNSSLEIPINIDDLKKMKNWFELLRVVH